MTLDERIAAHPFLRGFSPGHCARLARCAMDVHFPAGETVFRAGDPANRFYLLESGQVELRARNHSGAAVVQRIGAGDVLGWSWLFPPWVWQFDAVALEPTNAIFIYGSRLREMCEDDPALGYALMRACAAVIIDRLQATRREYLRCMQRSGASGSGSSGAAEGGGVV